MTGLLVHNLPQDTGPKATPQLDKIAPGDCHGDVMGRMHGESCAAVKYGLSFCKPTCS